MKKITFSVLVSSLLLAGCGGGPTDEVSLCKQQCEEAMNSSQKQFCLSACETAKQYADGMGAVPVDDIVNDFNENIYGNMNEAQKAQMKAMQEAGKIPTDLTDIPTMPMNPEDWEPNEDGLDNTGECAGVFCE